MKSVSLSIMLIAGLSTMVHAQTNAKREACLKEAEAKGLYTSSSRNPGKFNAGMAPQRQEFMKECMGRK